MVTTCLLESLCLDVHDCFSFIGESELCLVVGKHDGIIYFYREGSDHLFSHSLLSGVYVFYYKE